MSAGINHRRGEGSKKTKKKKVCYSKIYIRVVRKTRQRGIGSQLVESATGIGKLVESKKEKHVSPATLSYHSNMERMLQPGIAGGGSSLRYANSYEICLQNPIYSSPAPPPPPPF